MSGYQFDVFLSYRRAGTVLPWVHNHFHRMLVKCLTDELERRPEIFIDVDGVEVGDHWPDTLAQAHSRSRLLVGGMDSVLFRLSLVRRGMAQHAAP